MNKSFTKLLQIVIAAALLCLLIYQAGLFNEQGRKTLLDTLGGANVLMLCLSVFVGLIINLASTFKWWLLVRAQRIVVGYWRVFCYYLVGQFYNQILPTSVGGDVVRSYELGRFTGRQADALASVFVERYTGVLVLLLIAGASVLAQLSRFNSVFIYASLMAFTVGLALIAWLVFDMRAYLIVRQFFLARAPRLAVIFDKLDSLFESISHYRESPTVLVVAFANSLLFYFIAVINVYVTALVFQADVEFWDILIATPVIMLMMNLPISLGNLFLMEFSYTSVLALMGYSPALGLSIAVTMRLKSLVDGIIGGVLHPFFVTKKHE